MPAESDKIVREKIAGMDVLPEGVTLNSTARWQQIEQALQPAKKRTAKWYYAAAVFLGVAASLLVLNKEHEQIGPVLLTKKMAAPYKKALVIAQNIPAIKKHTPGPVHVKKTIVPPHTQEPISAAAPVMQHHDLPPISPVIETPLNPAPLKPVVTATHKEPAKPNRLKIVHLNELGAEQEMIYTRTPSRKMQAMDELPDEQTPPQLNKAWWQPKPKPVTAITDHP